MTILVSRHAQSPENLYGKGACGMLEQMDIPLSEDGEKQAVKLGKFLARSWREQGTSAVSIYMSPYRRVRETARLIQPKLAAAGIAFTSTLDSRLGEIDFLPRGAELVEGRVLFSTRALARESVAEITTRLQDVADKIARHEETAPVLVLTHSTPMRGLAALFADKPLTEIGEFPRPDNCAVWKIERGGLPRSLFAGFAPPARIAAPEDMKGERAIAVSIETKRRKGK